MKGLLLAGGHGTRLRPLTFTGNKHMIPIANQPMLFYGIRHLAEAGIRDIGVVLGPFREGIEEAVGDGASFGVQVSYIHQGPPRGLADAVRCAKPFLRDDPFVMYLGDNLLEQGARPLVDAYEAETPDAVIGVTPVSDPSRFGVVQMNNGQIVSVVEKPKVSQSNLALIGVYLFTRSIHPIIDSLVPSARGELEITEAIWNLHRSGHKVKVERVRGWWKDTGRPEDLLEANEMVLRSRPPEWFVRLGTVSPSAELTGSVAVGAGSVVGPQCRISGPAILGQNVELSGGAAVGPCTALGDQVVMDGASVSRSIVLEGARLEGPLHLVNSIVGRGAAIRADGARTSEMVCILGDATQVRF